MTSPQLVILADDLTGAADSAGRAVMAGHDAVILPDSRKLPVECPSEASTIAINTDSRALSPEAAAARVAAAVATTVGWQPSLWYKKFDSTLRGNLGAEEAALLHELGPATRAAICPAFPAQGRGLEDGYLVCAMTAPRTVHLPSRLAEQTNLPVGAIPLATVRRGVEDLTAALAESPEARLLVIDGMTDDDLATIVTAARAQGLVLCGSAGMVARLAEQMPPASRRGARAERGGGPLLVVVGSGSDMAHAQIAAMVATKRVHVRVAGPGWRGLDLIGAGSKPAGDWLLHLPAPEPGTPLEGAAARREVARLADLVAATVERLQPTDLILVGGDTATFVLRGLSVERLDVVTELLPGIPMTEGQDAQGVRRRIVLKAGSFGDERVLVELWQRMRAEERVHA